MVERLHRALMAALKCTTLPWVDALPSVLLGLRTTYKENLKASPAEIVYGTSLQVPAEFFTTTTSKADSSTFVKDDKIKKLLEQPHTGPHRVINRNDSRTFTVGVDGEAEVVSIDQLKPAHLELAEPPCTAEDTLLHSVLSEPVDPPPVPSSNPKQPGRSVSFADPPKLLTERGVDVTTQQCVQAAHSRRKQLLTPRVSF
ncbi:uncharacterized protein LOC106644415 [Copidosoma floridanum]|uniref:uncharacterized protein LOC106644415 n=1 Tax=Copidosoma floridanum TaxID=29053 RepID=UPI0006C9B1E5|nr:uncharacterized protein LOC106644415 [Copidosoma floridanum]